MAIVGGIIVGAAALIGAGINAYESYDASQKQLKAAADSNKVLTDQYNQAINREQPWTTAGLGALGQLQTGMANNAYTQDPMTFKEDAFNFQADPGYQFRLQQGQQAIQNSAAARGNLLSGATLKAMNNYGQGQAAQAYQQSFQNYQTNRNFDYNAALNTYSQGAYQKGQQYNQLAGMAQMGSNAAMQQGGYNTQLGQGQSSLLLQAGNSAAAGTLGVGNAWNQGLQGAAGNVISGINQNAIQNQMGMLGTYGMPYTYGSQYQAPVQPILNDTTGYQG